MTISLENSHDGTRIFCRIRWRAFLEKNGSLYRILDNTDSGHNMGYLLLGALRLNDHS